MAKKRTLIETLEIKNYGLAEDIEAFLVSAGYDIDVEVKEKTTVPNFGGGCIESYAKHIVKIYASDEILGDKK